MSLVVKVGGGLLKVPGTLETVCRAIEDAGRSTGVIVVPGGGPFADTVRAFDREVGLSAERAHWMAMLAMDQYGHVLAERIEGATYVDEPAAAAAALRIPGITVLAPSRWMRAAAVFPPTWDVTSDSIAAFVAGALDANHLILVKPVSGGRELLDAFFDTACPVGLATTIVGCDRLNELPAILRERAARTTPSHN